MAWCHEASLGHNELTDWHLCCPYISSRKWLNFETKHSLLISCFCSQHIYNKLGKTYLAPVPDTFSSMTEICHLCRGDLDTYLNLPCINGIFQSKLFVIFKQILVLDGWGISCGTALRWLLLDLSDDKSTVIHGLALYHQATSRFLSQCWSSLVAMCCH